MIIVDRIEEEIAVVYFGEIKRDIPVSELPEGVHEGSILRAADNGYVLDPEAEAARRKLLAERTRRLFK